jgi:hypothetical protein
MTSDQPADANLAAEVEVLRAELAARDRGWRTAWRPIVSGVLLVAVVILAPLSVVATWTHREIADTDRYVDSVTPLASNPDVQAAIAQRISTVILSYIDVPKITDKVVNGLSERGLGDRATTALEALSVPLEGAVTNFVEEKVLEVVQSDAFEQAWIEANRQAHTQMVAVLTGETGNSSVNVSDKAVTVNLAAFIDTVKQTLVDNGFRLAQTIPTVDASFVVFESASLGKAQRGFHLLDLAAAVLPVLTLVLIALAVWVARSRRTALVASGLCVALGMILLGLTLAVLRPLYLDSLPASVSQSAAAAIFDTLVSYLRHNLRIVLVIALLVALIAWLLGPSRSARRIRSGVAGGVSWARERSHGHVDIGPFGRTLGELRTPLRIGVVSVGVVILLFNNPVTGKQVTWTLLIVLALLAALEVFSNPPTEDVVSVTTSSDVSSSPRPPRSPT